MKPAHEEYLDTVKRIEPDVHPLDHDGAMASIAISLKRIADAMYVDGSGANRGLVDWFVRRWGM